MLDMSHDKPAVRPVTAMNPGWTEGLQLMVTGEKRTFWVPTSLASQPPPAVPAQQGVTIVVELLEILSAPKTPSDVKAPPKDAVVEADGLATKVLAKGTGTAHPTAKNGVSVQYAGWTTDGKMFDSSYTRGEPATFAVTGVIPGWSEALQLMVEGEKRRVWIPEQLAYKGQPGRPPGMLVFDVELVKINDAPPMPRFPGAMGMGGMGGMMGRPPMHPPMPPPHP
jgi:peptidylprolyl isomerase